MTEQPVLVSTDDQGVGTLTLNRPHRNNAYDDKMMVALLAGVETLVGEEDVRVIVLRGNGDYFQAGADLKWMDALSHYSEEDNLKMSRLTTDAIRHLNSCPKPTVALVHGGCFGGGVGILAACDIVIASEEAKFSITETRWGLVAGPILPQLCDSMGLRALRRYALSAERFSSSVALRHGLVHELCETGKLDDAAAPVIKSLLSCSPSAISETKNFVLQTAAHLVDDTDAEEISKAHAARRQSADGREGLASFNEKRSANWS